MLEKVFKVLEKKGLGSNSFMNFDSKLMAKLYFEGDEEELVKFLYTNRASLETEESIDLFLEGNFSLMYLFKLLSKDLVKASGVVDMVKVLSNEKLKELVGKIPNEHWAIFDEFYLENKETIKEVVYDTLGIGKLEKEAVKKKLFSTNKTAIANEFGVDIKTLNKWLEVFFNDKFEGVRKIYYDEYVEIFKALFLARDEELDLVENINTYKKRLSRGLKFRKKFIAEYTNELSPLDISTLLKIQKEQLGDLDYYNFTDVYPYSITRLLVEESGDEMDF